MSTLHAILMERPVPKALRDGLEDLAPTILTRTDLGRIDEAAEIVERAEKQATRWDEGARTRFRTARKAGYHEGHSEATAILLTERIDLAARIEALKAEQARQINTLLTEALRRFFGIAPWADLIRQAVDQAMSERSPEPRAVLAAIPEDLARLTAEADVENWIVDVVADPSLRPGEVELRTTDGVVGISLARHLDHLIRALDGEMGRQSDD